LFGISDFNLTLKNIFRQKFGLYKIDFEDPMRARTRKASAVAYAKIIQDNGFPEAP
jgi:beta-glucosidase/6-phospho-beta-glucosidase/beta-galactosidase